MRERVLEGVFEVREETRLEDEFAGPQSRQLAMQVLLGHARDGPQEIEWDVLPDHRGGLEQLLLPGLEPVDASGQDRLDGRGHPDRLHALDQPIGAAGAFQRPRLDQRPNAFLQEERIALGPGDQELPDGLQAGIGTQQSMEKLLGGVRAERRQAKLRVVPVALPPVPVLWAVADEQQEPGAGKAVHQTVQERLSLVVDPVQVLEDEQHRLHLGLAEQQPSHAVQRSLAALRRVHLLPRRILDWDIQERQQGREGGLQGPVEGQYHPGDLLPDPPRPVAGLDLEITLEHLDHREVRRGLPVGDRGALYDPPALSPVRVRELPEEPGLADAGLSHHRHGLALTSPGPLQGLPQITELVMASDEPGQAA